MKYATTMLSLGVLWMLTAVTRSQFVSQPKALEDNPGQSPIIIQEDIIQGKQDAEKHDFEFIEDDIMGIRKKRAATDDKDASVGDDLDSQRQKRWIGIEDIILPERELPAEAKEEENGFIEEDLDTLKRKRASKSSPRLMSFRQKRGKIE